MPTAEALQYTREKRVSRVLHLVYCSCCNTQGETVDEMVPQYTRRQFLPTAALNQSARCLPQRQEVSLLLWCFYCGITLDKLQQKWENCSSSTAAPQQTSSLPMLTVCYHHQILKTFIKTAITIVNCLLPTYLGQLSLD